MKRGIEDSNDCETMSLNPATQAYQQQMIKQQQPPPQQQQQQQQFTNSSSPFSNSSSNSSSCLTSASSSYSSTSSSSSSYSPLQLAQQSIATYYSLPPGSQTLNPNQIILTIPAPPGTVTQQQQQQQLNNFTLTNNSSTTQKPEAKKVKTQKSQPSKVVHIRNIPPQITEIEIIQFGLIFGNIINVLNLRSKCQAFLEFEKCEEAQAMINYFANNPISVAGRQIFVQYSNYKNLVTDPSNTNNQVAKAALDLAKDLHKAAQSGGQNTVLRAMIQNMLYVVSLDTIYQIFSKYGPVLKIITFTKNDKFQALIQMKDAASAQAAKNTLHGQSIYNSCCTLHIDYSKLNTLNVKYNNEKSRDYTNPLLPAGDCPDHLALGPGGVIASPIQLQMAAAAAAAAGYATPFTTHIPAGYHLAPAGNPFMQFTGKYLPHHQTLISASSLLQPTTGANLAHPGAQTSLTANHPAAMAAAAAAYNLNQQTFQQHHQQQQQNQQQQTQSTMTNGAAPNQHQTNSGSAAAGAPMLIPFLQNLNDEASAQYIMMYTAS